MAPCRLWTKTLFPSDNVMTHKYLLDTNIISEMARNPAGPVTEKVAAVGEASVCTNVIVACEVHYGLAKRASPRLTEQMTTILERIEILNLTGDIAVCYGEIRTHLESMGAPMGPNDLLIAAHARTAGLVVVTANDREFSRISDLQVENWVKG